MMIQAEPSKVFFSIIGAIVVDVRNLSLNTSW
jgi:hypothetical protein